MHVLSIAFAEGKAFAENYGTLHRCLALFLLLVASQLPVCNNIISETIPHQYGY
jgi:hypothetical protein